MVAFAAGALAGRNVAEVSRTCPIGTAARRTRDLFERASTVHNNLLLWQEFVGSVFFRDTVHIAEAGAKVLTARASW